MRLYLPRLLLVIGLLLASCADTRPGNEADDVGGGPGPLPTPDGPILSDLSDASGFESVSEVARLNPPDPENPELAVQLELAASSVVVDEPLAYSVVVLRDGIEDTADWSVIVSVTPSQAVTLTETELSFGQPGDYTVEARASRDDEVLTDSADVSVAARQPANLTVVASPDPASAGQPVTFTVSVTDADDVPLDAAALGVALRLEPAGTPLEPGVIEATLTTPGRYEIHASLGESLTAVDVFHVVPGAPASLIFELAPHDNVDPGDTVDYTADVRDAYDNLVETAEVAVTTDPAGPAVDARRIAFDSEGTFWVDAQVVDTELTARAGPVVVDGSPPNIVITTPERGTYQTSASIEVAGTIVDSVTGVSSATLNGQALALGSDGSFSTQLNPDLGIQLIVVEASDAEGQTARVVQSLLHGTQFRLPGQSVSRGLLARANQGAIDVIEDRAEDLISVATIADALIGTQVFRECVDFGFGTACISGTATDFTASGVSVSMNPNSGGYVQLNATISNPVLDVTITENAFDTSFTQTITATSATLSARAWTSVSNGNVSVSLTNVNANVTGLSLGFNLFFPFDALVDAIEDAIAGEIEDAVEAEVAARAPQALDDALSELEIATSFEVLGTTLFVEAEPEDVLVDTNGITLVLASIVEPESSDGNFGGLGALRTNTSAPTYGSSPAFVASLSDDFLNQALYAVYDAGLIADLIDGQTDGLDLSAFELLVPDATGFEFEVDPLLPPVYRPDGGAGSQGEIQIGDMLLELYADTPSGRLLVTQVAISAFADLSVGVGSENTIDIAIDSTPEVYFQGLVSMVPNLSRDDLAALLEALLPGLLGDLLDGVQSIPIPAFAGLTITGSSIALSGPAGDYINLGGALISE